MYIICWSAWMSSKSIVRSYGSMWQLPKGDLPAPLLSHCPVGLRLVRVLDEAQQVLLVYAGSRMDVHVHLSHIIYVSVGVTLQLFELKHFI